MCENQIFPTIVVVGYNRKKSLQRTLNAVVNAEYKYDNVNLIVSLDHSDNEEEMKHLAEDFGSKWMHGSFEVRTVKERLGLRKHILKCGDIAIEQGAVIILEDDIVVSPYFYDFIFQAVNHYKNNDSIAGFALYNYNWNNYVRKFFIPINNGTDCYLGQFSISWGQCWTARQWTEFKKWYNQNQTLTPNKNIPDFVYQCPETSWAKYFAYFVVTQNKYYLMPYVSLSTNFGDIGQHTKTCAATEYQVPLLYGDKLYNFPDEESAVKYDMFFNNINLIDFLSRELNTKNICINLYGDKCMDGYEFALTTLQLHQHIVQSYSLVMYPPELNIFYNVPGADIFLYDLQKKARNKHDGHLKHLYKTLNYNIKYLSFKKALIYCIFRFKASLGEIMKKLGKRN